MLSFRFIKPSHYYSILLEFHLHKEFKGSSNCLIGKYDCICNYIDTYSKLMRLLHCELTPWKLAQLSRWLHYTVTSQASAQKMGDLKLVILHRQLHAKSFMLFDWIQIRSALHLHFRTIDRVLVEELLKRKIYSRQLDEKVKEQMHSVSSTTRTMHIEEACFLSVLTIKWESKRV